jgi:hypothetical protein
LSRSSLAFSRLGTSPIFLCFAALIPCRVYSFGFDFESLKGRVAFLNRKEQYSADLLERNLACPHPVIEGPRADAIAFLDGLAPDEWFTSGVVWRNEFGAGHGAQTSALSRIRNNK